MVPTTPRRATNTAARKVLKNFIVMEAEWLWKLVRLLGSDG